VSGVATAADHYGLKTILNVDVKWFTTALLQCGGVTAQFTTSMGVQCWNLHRKQQRSLLVTNIVVCDYCTFNTRFLQQFFTLTLSLLPIVMCKHISSPLLNPLSFMLTKGGEYLHYLSVLLAYYSRFQTEFHGTLWFREGDSGGSMKYLWKPGYFVCFKLYLPTSYNNIKLRI
jgi:hypothetical protein